MRRDIAKSALIASLLTCAALPAFAQVPASGTARHVYVSFNLGYQATTNSFSNTYSFPMYVEAASVTGSYSAKAAPMFDGGASVRVWRDLIVGVALSRYSHLDAIAISARVPQPFFFGQFRETQGTSAGAPRTETGAHVQAGWMVGQSPRVRAVIFGGPSWVTVTQAVISDTSFADTFPYETVAVGLVRTTDKSASRIGLNAGTDITYLLVTRPGADVGVGFTLRFSRASVVLTDASGQRFSVNAGGAQAGAGIRFGF